MGAVVGEGTGAHQRSYALVRDRSFWSRQGPFGPHMTEVTDASSILHTPRIHTCSEYT